MEERFAARGGEDGGDFWLALGLKLIMQRIEIKSINAVDLGAGLDVRRRIGRPFTGCGKQLDCR
jgi:hypothetical protein